MQNDCANTCDNADIARWEVSEDGVNWRPYDPQRDTDPLLHKRIEFAPPPDDGCSRLD